MGLPAGLTVLSGLCEVSGDRVSPALHMPPGPACPAGFVSNTCPISRWQLAVRRSLNDSGAIGVERNVKCQLTPAHRQEALPQGPRLLAQCTGLPAAGRSRHSESWRPGALAPRRPPLSRPSLPRSQPDNQPIPPRWSTQITLFADFPRWGFHHLPLVVHSNVS